MVLYDVGGQVVCLVVGVKVLRRYLCPGLTSSQNLYDQSSLLELHRTTPIIFANSSHAIVQVSKSWNLTF